MIIDQPLLDSTIVRHEGKYWLFATRLGDGFNSDLHFYADNLFGPYTEHKANPVKSDLNGSRPAGNLIDVDGQLYRPSQNCRNYYGESITINRIKTLTTEAFEEEEYMVIEPNKNDEFNYGIHTINAIDDLIIVDGPKGYFEPVNQLRRKLKPFSANPQSMFMLSSPYKMYCLSVPATKITAGDRRCAGYLFPQYRTVQLRVHDGLPQQVLRTVLLLRFCLPAAG